MSSPTSGAMSEDMNYEASDPAIICRDVCISFDDDLPLVFDKLNLEIQRGEFVVVVGKSGGGKTTLLNVLVGALLPRSGTVSVLGQAPAAAKNETALMMARDALLPWRNARRNVEYGLELRGLDRDERRKRSATYLELVGLTDAADRWPWQLSQGMRQRVALARTWALHSEILLMDEPFSAVDAQTREHLQTEFLDLWALERRTVVFITHDLTEAVLLADRVIVIADGTIQGEHIVPLPRPRNTVQMMHDPDAVALLAELRNTISPKHPTT